LTTTLETEPWDGGIERHPGAAVLVELETLQSAVMNEPHHREGDRHVIGVKWHGNSISGWQVRLPNEIGGLLRLSDSR
jgi:hypothetical protein